VLGYLLANCGSCHDGSGDITVRSLALPYADLLRDADAVARRLVGHPTSWQVPNRPEGTSVLVDPEAPAESALLVRMHSRRPSSQMPPLGTVLRDGTAIDEIGRWIAEELGRRTD
jgi:hypothetical protein